MGMKRLHDMDVDDYLRDSVIIEPLALEEEFVRLPSDMAYWGQRYANALRASMIAGIELKRSQALLRIEHRIQLLDQLADNSKAKVTESMVDSAVELDPMYQVVQLRFVEAEVETVRLKQLLEAVRTKRDALVSLGSHIRAEMRNDPQIREEQTAMSRRMRGE
jgi:hypothetical protein